jgi:hypothetical protein
VRVLCNRLVGLAAVVVVATIAPPDGSARPGRIVRIERPRTGNKGTLRVCQYHGESSVMCYGTPPRPGESGTLLTDIQPGARPTDGVRGVVKVEEVTATNLSNPGGGAQPCATGMWTAKLVADPNRVDSYASNVWIIFDAALGPEARLVQPPNELPGKVSGEAAPVTIDRDGDNVADYMVTWYQSDSSGTSGMRYTLDFWQNEQRGHDPRWRRLRQDHVSWCN